MVEHPVPRQITTFEFKLIGELTIKQFGFILFGTLIGVVFYFTVPAILLLNILVASLPVLLGAGLAFIPINDRPMDIYLRNLAKRLTSPTQYYFRKKNSPPKILLGITLPPRNIREQHLLAQQKLNAYLASKPKTTNTDKTEAVNDENSKHKETIKNLIINTGKTIFKPKNPQPSQQFNNSTTQQSQSLNNPATSNPAIQQFSQSNNPAISTVINQPHFTLSGRVYTHNGVPIGGILLYLKQGTQTIRLFKSAADGSFSNNLPIAEGEYLLEIVDPKNIYRFAKMNINGTQTKLEIFSQA